MQELAAAALSSLSDYERQVIVALGSSCAWWTTRSSPCLAQPGPVADAAALSCSMLAAVSTTPRTVWQQRLLFGRRPG